MAAKTNWKYIIVAIGKVSGGMPAAAAGTMAWPVMKVGGQRRHRFAQEGKPLRPERHVVGEQHPHDHHRNKGVDRHEGGIDRPFFLDDAAIKNDEARNALQSDKCRGGHLPGVIAAIKPFW